MKILFVLHYPPPIHGAAAIGLQIIESKLINDAFDCKYINLGTSITINEIGGKSFIKLFRYLSIFGQVFWELISNRPDLCYISITSKGVPFYKDATLAFLVKLFGVKLIYHFHNKGVSLRQGKFFDDLMYRVTFKNSSVILLSKYLYPDVQKYVLNEQVWFCPNGIPDVEIKKNIIRDKNVVELLFLSNLIESKGVFVLLEVCKILQNKKLNFQCTFVGGVGDISEQQFQSKLKELKIEDSVNYAGKKFGKDKESFFTNTDIFILPTLNDCFPLVLLEAMQYSIPVISTFEGGIPDIVEDGVTGFLVPQKNIETLAEKLEILIRNPELRIKMGIEARNKFVSEFTLNKFETRFKEILQQVTKKK